MAVLNPSILIITLNYNGLNTKAEIVRMNKKEAPNRCCPQDMYFKYED